MVFNNNWLKKLRRKDQKLESALFNYFDKNEQVILQIYLIIKSLSIHLGFFI